ncbi:MAG: 6-bladed beta-propeller [Alistipes sp.]|nr:6-bladed beta-propeller [Alistipes sp.]
MKKLPILIISLLAFACNNSSNNDTLRVSMPLDKQSTFLGVEEIISDIDILPLTYPDNVLLSDDNTVKFNNDIILIIDRLHSSSMHIFNRDGSYRATIAAKGRGPGEYLDMASVQLLDNQIMVYSNLRKSAFFYDYEGKFIAQKELSHTPYNLYKTADGWWGYMGYGNGQMKERIVRMNADGEIIEKLLPTDANILSMMEIEDVFVPSDKGLLLRETFSNEIVALAPSSVERIAYFDFGKYSIPANYYTQSSPMEAAEMLFQSDFATINQLFANKSTLAIYVECNMADNPDNKFDAFAYSHEKSWKAIKIDRNDHLFYKSIKSLTEDDKLLLLVGENYINELAERFPQLADFDKSKFSDRDKHHIVLCKLKH